MLAVVVAVATFVWASPVESLRGFKGEALSYELNLQTPPVEPDLYKGTKDGAELPEELTADLRVERLGRLSLSLTRQRFMGLPKVTVTSSNGTSSTTEEYSNKNVFFYTDKANRASLACDLRRDRNTGEQTCQTSVMFSVGNYSCYIDDSVTKADCSPNKYNVRRDVVSNRTGGVPVQPINVDGVPSRRGWAQARSTKDQVLPAPGSKTVEYVTVVDDRLMEVFYDRYKKDGKAKKKAAMYFSLMANEINVYYDNFRESTNGDLSLFVYPTAVIMPERDENFAWSKDHNDGTDLVCDDACDDKLALFAKEQVLANMPTDHVMFLTGYDLKWPDFDILGYAKLSSVCDDTRDKISMNEYLNDVGTTVAHEMGHALGALHDGNEECEGGKYLMSNFAFAPDDTNVDTYYQVSPCTVRAVKDHLDRFPQCTLDNDFTDKQFEKLWCSGFLGQAPNSLDDQCKVSTGYAGSTACDSVTQESQCYAINALRCMTADGQCNGVVGFLWNGTPCGADKFCFKGRCVSTFEICPDRPEVAPCSCCGRPRGQERRGCCRTGRQTHNKAHCYCCGPRRGVKPPAGWAGPEY